MLNGLLLTLNIIVCVLLIGVVLMQRSEGGALGGGGGPTGLVTARGAGDLLTRMTWILFALFLILSLAQTIVGGRERSSSGLVKSLKGTTYDASNNVVAPASNAQTGAVKPLDLSAPKPTVNIPLTPTPTPAAPPAR